MIILGIILAWRMTRSLIPGHIPFLPTWVVGVVLRGLRYPLQACSQGVLLVNTSKVATNTLLHTSSQLVKPRLASTPPVDSHWISCIICATFRAIVSLCSGSISTTNPPRQH